MNMVLSSDIKFCT